jgi:hypothetical protein
MKSVLMGAIVLGLTAASAAAQTRTLTAKLTGAEEIPGPVLTGAFGFATVTVNLTNRTVSWVVDVYNFPSGLTIAHIHVGPPGVAGPIIVNFPTPGPLSNDFRLSGTATAAEILLRPDVGIRSPDDAFESIIGENTYVNIHSQVNGPGEVRGRLFLQEDAK